MRLMDATPAQWRALARLVEERGPGGDLRPLGDSLLWVRPDQEPIQIFPDGLHARLSLMPVGVRPR